MSGNKLERDLISVIMSVYNKEEGILKEKKDAEGLLLMPRGSFSSPHYFTRLVQLPLINI